MPTNFWNAVRVWVQPEAVARNFSRLRPLGRELVPVVKADAYGHGLLSVARALVGVGARRMAVGTVSEAVALREALPEVWVMALLGPMDWQDAAACQEYGVVPVVACAEQWDLVRLSAGPSRPLSIALKFDTGMARLGFSVDQASSIAQQVAVTPGVQVETVMSHLATADDPAAASFVAKQGTRLQEIAHILAQAGIHAPLSLANSAALIAHPQVHFHWQRPGIALYGANPLAGTPWQDRCPPLEPAMEVAAPVLQVRQISAGTTVSYGRTFTAPRPMRIAIVAVGYADAYCRGLSNRAFMVLGGRRVPVVGRVCMQMTAVDATEVPEVQVGDMAYLLGGPGGAAIRGEELAAWWGTIPYEVFCLLGQNPRSIRSRS
jgi:alanine racemase